MTLKANDFTKKDFLDQVSYHIIEGRYTVEDAEEGAHQFFDAVFAVGTRQYKVTEEDRVALEKRARDCLSDEINNWTAEEVEAHINFCFGKGE